MRGFFTVHEADDYQAWLVEQAEYLEEETGDDDDWGDDW
jgi:heme/copper-type cytochrome/quinol oxidase subunit 2